MVQYSLRVAALVAAAMLLQAGHVSALASEEIERIDVYPPEVRLEGSKDRQRFIVVATGADGVTQDLTDEVAFEVPGHETREPTEPRKKFLTDPLYSRLLDQARERLEARAQEVSSLDAAAIGARRDRVRGAILDSFDGFPERTPLNARVVGSVDRGDHVMEKVIFESRPQFQVTANLYLPKNGPRPYPFIQRYSKA